MKSAQPVIVKNIALFVVKHLLGAEFNEDCMKKVREKEISLLEKIFLVIACSDLTKKKSNPDIDNIARAILNDPEVKQFLFPK